MKTILFFFAMAAGVSASAANHAPDPAPTDRGGEQPPVYYTGNGDIAASSANSLPPATTSPSPPDREAEEAHISPAPTERGGAEEAHLSPTTTTEREGATPQKNSQQSTVNNE
jgi:hypothetical protein